MFDFEKEALKYDIFSLINLQNKRKENIAIFEISIKNERAASQQEEASQFFLENKLKLHDSGSVKLSDTEKEWILSDLPKFKTTFEKRNQTIMLLKAAILEEYEMMDNEEKMIRFLERRNDGKV